MAVIDSLVLELNLDATKFTAAQKEAVAALRRFQSDATKSGNEVEAHQQKLLNFFQKLKTEAIGIGAAILGARGVKDFVDQFTKIDAAVGRASRTLNLSVEDLSAWQVVAKQTGSSGEALTGTFQAIEDAVKGLQVGIPNQLIPFLGQWGVAIYDMNNNARSVDKIFLDIAKHFKGWDPAKAAAIMKSAGFPPDVVNSLLEGDDALKKLFDNIKKNSPVTQKASEDAKKLQSAWEGPTGSVFGLGNIFYDALAPALTWATDKLHAFTDAFANAIIHPIQDKNNNAGRVGIPGIDYMDDSSSSGIAIKPGAGSATPATSALMKALSGINGLNRVTSLSDFYHRMLGAKDAHSEGRALDLTLSDPSQHAHMAAMIRASLAAAGINANVLDEYKNKSKGWTGGHLHIQVNRAMAEALGGQVGAIPVATGSSSVINSGGNSSVVNNNTVNVRGGDISNPSRLGWSVATALSNTGRQ